MDPYEVHHGAAAEKRFGAAASWNILASLADRGRGSAISGRLHRQMLLFDK